MGTSRTPAEFRRKVASLPEVVIEAERNAVLANAKAAKENALRELRKHVPSKRMKNVGRNGAKLNARYRIDNAQGRSADIKAVGPWQFVENDTRQVPYGVGSRYAKGSRKSRSAAILAGDYTVGASKEKFRTVKGADGSKSKVSRGSFQGRKAMLLTPWGWRASVKVTKKRQGKHPWKTAFLKTQREAPQAYQKAANTALRKALRG
jgi:hypothetical protein